jgi:hypothetical protein
MPLVKYEVRCEHSLANPELYRSAAPDDVEGLLEGVAMAGLVGIVRQLGDLAEYACTHLVLFIFFVPAYLPSWSSSLLA